jgi:hypothetical protein
MIADFGVACQGFSRRLCNIASFVPIIKAKVLIKMRLSPLFLVAAAGMATLSIGQLLLPTARAQSTGPAPAALLDYRVSVKSLHTQRTPHGLEVTGQIFNTGRQTLTYTSLVLVFTNAAGQGTREDAYLTTGPVRPGQSAEFRAFAPDAPPFIGISLRLREAGHPVLVETEAAQTLGNQNSDSQKSDSQNSDKRRTTAW